LKGNEAPAESTSLISRCMSPWDSMYIKTEGLVTPFSPCTALIGNIDQAAAMELWNGERMQDLRRNILDNNSSAYCPVQSQCEYGFEFEETAL
jgi:hypothetical protein